MRESIGHERLVRTNPEDRGLRLKRVYVGGPLTSGSVLELSEAASLHLAKVMRVRPGDELALFTGDGREFQGTVQSLRGSRVVAAVGEPRTVDRESPLAVTLAQCIARGDRMDLIVQKATELGVARIVPLLSRRSVVRLDVAQAESKAAHWRAIAVNACEQCGRNRLPVIELPRALSAYLAAPASEAPRLLLEPEPRPGTNDYRIAGAVEIAIGPEGGFDPEELEAFRICGFAEVSLGPRVLRTETAAIAALVWLQARYGDIGCAPGG